MATAPYHIARQEHLGDMLDQLQALGLLTWRWDYADRRAIYWITETGVPGQPLPPRVEGAFTRIERWTRVIDGDVHWRTLSGDNTLAVFGRSSAERISDPADKSRVFSWLLSETRDAFGNAIVYEYRPEDNVGVDVTQPHELNHRTRSAGKYLKRIRYGNRIPLLDAQGRRPVELTDAQRADADWLFEIVFDYGDHSAADPVPAADRPCKAGVCR